MSGPRIGAPRLSGGAACREATLSGEPLLERQKLLVQLLGETIELAEVLVKMRQLRLPFGDVYAQQLGDGIF